MNEIIVFLISHGIWGMFVGALMAGTLIPISSELIMVGLLMAGCNNMALLLSASLGNAIGSMINYWIGTFGREEWVVKYCKVKPERFKSGKDWVQKWGPMIGFFAWVPGFGSVTTTALGFLRAPAVPSFFYILGGKGVRYLFMIIAWNMGLFSVFNDATRSDIALPPEFNAEDAELHTRIQPAKPEVSVRDVRFDELHLPVLAPNGAA